MLKSLYEHSMGNNYCLNRLTRQDKSQALKDENEQLVWRGKQSIDITMMKHLMSYSYKIIT